MLLAFELMFCLKKTLWTVNDISVFIDIAYIYSFHLTLLSLMDAFMVVVVQVGSLVLLHLFCCYGRNLYVTAGFLNDTHEGAFEDL